jgi:diguanylate cyclase (GGDEF)-like protein/PAS domain S-box-containing protein
MVIDNHTQEEILSNLHDGLYFVDKNRIISYWNKAAERITGFKAEEVIGKSCAHNILTHIDCNGKSLCKTGCPLRTTISKGQYHEMNAYMHHKDGHRLPVAIRAAPMRDEQGEIVGSIELFTDISNQPAYDLQIKELEKMAFLDPLTQLANRNYINQELTGRLEEFKRYNIPFGILFADIDHFKKFNDTHGHDVGDQVLKAVAHTFTSNARPFDLYGRWGGEEFIGIIRNIEPHNLAALGNRMRVFVENSYITHHEEPLHVTLSIGATGIHKDETIEQLLKRSDTLLYQSKENGRNLLTLG